MSELVSSCESARIEPQRFFLPFAKKVVHGKDFSMKDFLLVEKLLADFTLAENGRRVARQVSSARPHDSRASSSSCGAE